MTPLDQAIAHLVKLMLAGALAGVFWRRLYRVSMAFPAYLLSVLVFNGLMTFWPDRFYTHSFFLMSEAVWDACEVALALELAYRAFRAFPRARTLARWVIAIVLASTTIVLVRVSAAGAGRGSLYEKAVLEWHPRIFAGMVWLLAGTSVLVLWYRLPIHPFQRTVLLGLGSYRVVAAALVTLMSTQGWSVRVPVNLVDALMYLSVAGYWAYSSWQRSESPALNPLLVRRLRLDQV